MFTCGQVERYRKQLTAAEEKLEEISLRSSRRIAKLTANWETADAEVLRLDGLLEKVRQQLTGHRWGDLFSSGVGFVSLVS